MLVSREGTFVSTKESLLLLSRDLLTIKDSVGAPLCSCRHYDDKAAEAGQGFWNRPRVPMRERKECHCMLFLTPENDFAGQEQVTTYPCL
ncbi:hypothetical protein RHGRI_022931 [Rhododendron griersonianum]|uniref:Ferredoxin-thioredoxin reductase catalytic chain, chloroplastic n=1 Tax=Rhododendron griersonianum TaxID=479676 RepID=A0AAV6J521_9ERIC|nr:hypothetical protein RHGRI_022931 [Rhododendron griersonianum]